MFGGHERFDHLGGDVALTMLPVLVWRLNDGKIKKLPLFLKLGQVLVEDDVELFEVREQSWKRVHLQGFCWSR